MYSRTRIEHALLHQILIKFDRTPCEGTAITGQAIVARAMLRMPDDESDPAVTEIQEVLRHLVGRSPVTDRNPGELHERPLGDSDARNIVL